MIVGSTERGLCWLALGSTSAEAEASLREEFPLATLRRDPSLSQLVDAALETVRDGSDLVESRARVESLDLRGTVFQLRVWQACAPFHAAKRAPIASLPAKWANQIHPRRSPRLRHQPRGNCCALSSRCWRERIATGYRWA